MTQMILPLDSTLYQALSQLIHSQRLVVFVGLPGVGKSLLTQQLALMADQAGRHVHLLQWDVARQPFAADQYVLASYPEVDGVTHAAIRKALGLWVRAAIWRWHGQHADRANMLIAEVPLVGNRLIELAQQHDDEIEPLLSDSATRFVILIPSRELRRAIEGKREASSDSKHSQSSTDAIPQVLRAAWREVRQVAQELKIAGPAAGDRAEYDPEIYQGVYTMLLKHRHTQPLPVSIHLPTEGSSPHHIPIQHSRLAPDADEVRSSIARAEQLYPDMLALERAVNSWYIV
jgi:hypothetical protein